ncbi:hypothetical protein GCM10025331_37590 [Actinoplanes utahensis]|uniref:Knr4/Smi1-like domain-containing protein n=2 Tax=Actinoplanes utahensis TaxID=1869 RepID=A0A0A6WWI2_ACTUT|nr:hypothetical protein MB27_42685 [Actinoplanes utahensis]GIF31624.1 hypothetical protein Aut01nite_46100 [Actinoplanes utahensis]
MVAGLEDLRALCGRDGDHRRGWAFVRAMTEAYGYPLADGDGVDEAVLRSTEDRLGVPLPAALREAYLLFGNRRDLTATQDWLVPPQSLEVGAGGVLVFRRENQNCAVWGVPENALGQDDPPAVLDAGDGWVPYTDRLSVALVEMVMSEAMFSGYEDHVDNRELDGATLAALEAGFEPLPLPVLPFWAGMEGPGVRWLSGPDVLLRDDGGEWLWVHGRTPEAVQAVRDRLPGDWLMVPDD